MEVKIGIQMAPRELVIETDDSDDISGRLDDALAENNGVFSLVDSHGNRVLIPAAKIAYIEIGSAQPRRMGFGA